MKVRCRTNIDDYKREQWPEELCCRPIKGDMVRSKSGQILHVVDITHTMYNTHEWSPNENPVWRPMLIIELHERRAV